MSQKLFTKSAFKQALECPASLYYYYDSEHYANQNNEDDFLQALAEGGQQVGDLAKVYYKVPEECDIKELKYEPALARTAELFQRENVTIAEAAFRWENCFVRADIIEKKGKQINLIEVKATSWNPDNDSFWQKKKGHENMISRSIRPYLYDVAFQKYVIQNALGVEYTVTAFLMMADKRSLSPVDGMNPMFEVVNVNNRAQIRRSLQAAELAKAAPVLTASPVDEICKRIIAGETGEQREEMSGMLFTVFVKEMSSQYVNHEHKFVRVGKQCISCPFYSKDEEPQKKDGKRECWKKMAHFSDEDFVKPSVAELWSGGAGGKNAEGIVVKSPKGYLMDNGIYFLSNIKPESLPASKKESVKGELVPETRRLLQLALCTNNAELQKSFETNIHDGIYLDIPNLKAIMEKWRPPFHMIDFETSAAPIPFYKGMHPYEAVAFQFSHHIIEENGTIRHAGQYLNTEKLHFPNFEFVRELKKQLEKDNGTIFRYATHENTILRAIRKQVANSQEKDREELIDFIDSITHGTRKERNGHKGNRDMVDLLDIILKYYYHPDMKGSNSIKAVLPAILNSSARIREKYSRPIYGKDIKSKNYTPDEAIAWIEPGDDGKVKNPYKCLKDIASFLEVSEAELNEYEAISEETKTEGNDETIANGGAALAAYTKLQFADEKWTEAIAKALYRYCELDTMSMVFIWEYFHEMTGV